MDGYQAPKKYSLCNLNVKTWSFIVKNSEGLYINQKRICNITIREKNHNSSKGAFYVFGSTALWQITSFSNFFFFTSCQSNVAMSKSHDESRNFRAD